MAKQFAVVFVLVGLASLVTLCGAVDIGDRLVRTYTTYEGMPSTEDDALSAGWVENEGGCLPGLGRKFTYNQEGTTRNSPLVLFFTPAGQAAGVGMMVYGEVFPSLVEQGFWIQAVANEDQYFISVSFRSKDKVCSDTLLDGHLGDQVVINQNTIAYSIPTVESDSELQDNYERGACFESMGYHYFRDLRTAPELSWSGANLLPVVPMYNHGQIHAIFFASSSVQQSVISGSRWWEPVPLPNLLMCKNFCNSQCTFSDTWIWSTAHVYFRDPTLATCPGGCTIGCCPTEEERVTSSYAVAGGVIGAAAAVGILGFFAVRNRKQERTNYKQGVASLIPPSAQQPSL